jgi:hypothetical protein
MGILKNQISSNLGLKGGTPPNRDGASDLSQLHYNRKSKAQQPGDSIFDLDGKTPNKYQNPEV